jgi:multiple sugar transport system substrate-binding protein
MKTYRMSRRAALSAIGGAALGGNARQALAAPAVRQKATISYWTWADNPAHQKMVLDAVDAFNKSQEFITVEVDATMAVMDVVRKVASAYAAGSAPDVAGTVQTNVQNWFDTGILSPVDPFFEKWDAKSDYFPSVVDAMRSVPGQPVLYMPNAILPYVLYYRADWFDAAKIKPPATYDAFIAAAKAMTTADRAGYAMRGQTYYATQVIEPIWGSTGTKFVDLASGQVDFDSPAATAVTGKWVGMFTKDHTAQSTAVTDNYPQIFALMEKGLAAMWIYGTHAHPQLLAALGDRIQVVPTPRAGDKDVMLANPEGAFIVSSCKEKEAAWEFLMFMGSGGADRVLTAKRGLLPVRRSIAAEPAYQTNRFFKVAIDAQASWWHPPFAWKNWTDYQNKIAPYWQEALRGDITPQAWQQQAAKFLRGQA